MRKYDGNLIYSTRDEDGLIEVVEGLGVRSLHFGTLPRQSSMSLFDPLRLELPYTQVMMSCLLFHGTPARVLLIGLGGGSIAKFLLHHFPGCRLDAVEPRPMVQEVAHQYFFLPRTDRLQVHYTDGASFVGEQSLARQGLYDLILVDAYHADGMALSINRDPFFDGCQQMLHEDGVLSINLWGSEPLIMRDTLDLMHTSLGGAVYQVAVKGRANVIGHALAREKALPPTREWRQTSLQMQQRYGLEFRQFLRDMNEDRVARRPRLFF